MSFLYIDVDTEIKIVTKREHSDNPLSKYAPVFILIVSEWLLFNTNSAIFQNNVQWNDDEVRFVLDQYVYLDLYSASSLKQQSADRHVALLGHIISIPGQPVFVLSP